MKLSDPGRDQVGRCRCHGWVKPVQGRKRYQKGRAILNGSYVIWTIVGVLLIVALLIYIF